MAIVLSVILLILSANMVAVNSDASDCNDACTTACVNPDRKWILHSSIFIYFFLLKSCSSIISASIFSDCAARLTARCNIKCGIRCGPGIFHSICTDFSGFCDPIYVVLMVTYYSIPLLHFIFMAIIILLSMIWF